ncbi:MAG: phage holin family protein [Neisseria sp.]|nr:phage holin family protein [Neisseria sp.]
MKVSRLSLYKQRFRLGTDLFSLRLKMARLEWQDYQSGWSALLLSTAFLLVCALLSGLSLLFALQAALPAERAVWVFAVMCGVFLLIGAVLLIRIRRIRRGQQTFLQETLDGLSEDIALLRGDETLSERLARHENATD